LSRAGEIRRQSDRLERRFFCWKEGIQCQSLRPKVFLPKDHGEMAGRPVGSIGES